MLKVFAAMLLSACLAHGAEDTDRLNDAAGKYIAAKDPDKKKAEAWGKKFKAKVEQRAEDSRRGFDEAAQLVAFDWMSDRSAALKAKEDKAILELCRLFKWLEANRVAIPATALEEMRKDAKIGKLSEWLETEAKK